MSQNNAARCLLCPQCGAPTRYGTERCAYCGADLLWKKGACRVVLERVGNHPTLIISALQAIGEHMFSSGRQGAALSIGHTINALSAAMKNKVRIDDPVVLFETDDVSEADHVRKKIEENGGSVIIE